MTKEMKALLKRDLGQNGGNRGHCKCSFGISSHELGHSDWLGSIDAFEYGINIPCSRNFLRRANSISPQQNRFAIMAGGTLGV